MLQGFIYSKCSATLDAFGRSFAIIEFRPDGTIVKANQNFLRTMGYEATEIIGKNHRIFVDDDTSQGRAYSQFWSDLAAGRPNAGEFRCLGKGRKSIWIQASYCPVLNRKGKVTSVVTLAVDITTRKMRSDENQSILDAVSKSQGIISFTPTGEILDANENFLSAMGYGRSEIVGRHHRMFVAPAEADAPAYREFWKRLAGGEFISQEFRRVGKGGKEVLIQAAYNPVFDADGRVMMVKKFVFDLKERMESIDRLGKGLNRLSLGDLTLKIDAPLVETMESLRRDYNDTVDKLRSSISQIVAGSSAIQGNSREISQSADDLARRTEQQAASLEQTAAALEQITAAGKKAAEGAQHARDVVTTAKHDAAKTGEIVRKAVDAMGSIEKSAQQITQIISVIDEIAFQTNLLALNAGVEAARAGDAGRGFAVVASEVRALAQRSAEAAKEIKGLISTSSAQVADGVSLVAETGKALDRILGQVGDINAVVVDIAAGAQEQATGLHEVNSAINQMDQTTQQNAAMVEETTAASHSLAQEASNLNRLTGQFRVSENERQTAALTATTASPALNGPARLANQRPAPKPASSRKVVGARHSPATALSPANETWEEF